jgi:hypothetical protein
MNKFTIRYFHNTTPTLQRPDHPLYRVVDWSRIGGGDYAVVNPQDPAELLYLSERDYVVQIRVSMTQNHRLVTIASPASPRVHLPGELSEQAAEHAASPETSKEGAPKGGSKADTTTSGAKVPQSSASWFYPSSRTSSKNSPPRDAGLPLRALQEDVWNIILLGQKGKTEFRVESETRELSHYDRGKPAATLCFMELRSMDKDRRVED